MTEQTEGVPQLSRVTERFLLVRKKRRYSSGDSFPKISVRRELYEELADIASESGLSMTELASQALRFALDRVSWVEE